jgi:hypothetical protein
VEEAVASGRAGWGAALGLTFAVVLLSAFDALALVLLPLAILTVGVPHGRSSRWVGIGIVLWVLALLVAAGPLAGLSRGWALIVGSIFFATSVARPSWDVTSRALVAVAGGLVGGMIGLLATEQAGTLDQLIRTHFATISSMTIGDLQERMPDSAWIAELNAATEQISTLQADLFPALLALQTMAALALACWWVARLGRSSSPTFAVHRLRDFRFQDQLIWLLIAALLLYLLPIPEVGDRIAMNLILFMVGLYALRGLAIFVFLAGGTRSIATLVLGAVALVFLYPIAFTAALVLGVGDTWLDVRGRIAKANPT